MRKITCLMLVFLLAIPAFAALAEPNGAARFTYLDVFSFGMTKEEAERAGEDSVFGVIGMMDEDESEDESHFYLRFSSDYMFVYCVFPGEDEGSESSSLEEISVVFRDVYGAYMETALLQDDFESDRGPSAEQAERDYEAIERALGRKYGDAEEADAPIGLVLRDAMDTDGPLVTRLVRRVVEEEESVLVIEHGLTYRFVTDDPSNVISYRRMTFQEWKAYQDQQIQEQLDQFLDDIL